MRERVKVKESDRNMRLRTECNFPAVVTRQAQLSKGACYLYYVPLTAPPVRLDCSQCEYMFDDIHGIP